MEKRKLNKMIDNNNLMCAYVFKQSNKVDKLILAYHKHECDK